MDVTHVNHAVIVNVTKYGASNKVYFARILPKVGIYDLCELTIRTVMDNYFVGIDKRDKQAHIFGYDRIGVDVFKSFRKNTYCRKK